MEEGHSLLVVFFFVPTWILSFQASLRDRFLSNFESPTPVIIFFVNCNTCLYSCFGLPQDRTSKNVCCCSCSAASTECFVTKHANSILRSTFLNFWWICYCKILLNIFWPTFLLFWTGIIVKNFTRNPTCNHPTVTPARPAPLPSLLLPRGQPAIGLEMIGAQHPRSYDL